MKTVTVLTIVQWFCVFSFSLLGSLSYGYILPLDVVLNKSVLNSGNQIFTVEQDVIFTFDAEDFIIHETWLIEGDKNLKLTAVGAGPLKDLFRLVTIYNSKSKTTLFGKTKQTVLTNSDFFERYISIRSVDSFRNYLSLLSVEPSIRLSRAGGTTAFAIGEPSTTSLGKPQFWIDQNSFQIRKIRFLSESETSFEDYAIFGKTIYYPKTKKISWGQQNVTIKVRQVSLKTAANLASFYPQKLDQPSEITLSSKGNIGVVIQDFYKRFR